MATTTSRDLQLVHTLLERTAADLSMIADREIEVVDVETERVIAKARATGSIQISFKLGFHRGERAWKGCILVPLAEAISLGCYLMMMPDESVKEQRKTKELDRSLKDAMLEVGNFIGGAADAALRETLRDPPTVRSEGCQGVRVGQKPGFAYTPGETFILGRATMRLAAFPEFTTTLMLPAACFSE